ncbi:hypothetical protein HK096_004981 [Nowakowskiella sp. JEL0078]|nr:hypothetical protein HK096_004981 [Nowakowskiella sp. JEL0078]
MLKRPLILLTRKLMPKAQNLLESNQNIDLIQWHDPFTPIPRQVLLDHARRGLDGIIVLLTDKIDKEFLEIAGPRLKVVSTMSVGCDHIDVALCKSRSIRVGYTPDVLTDATADLTVGLLLATARKFSPAIDSVKNGGWGVWTPSWMTGVQLSGKTVGIVGFGRIGQAVAERLCGFRIGRLIYSTASPKPKIEFTLTKSSSLSHSITAEHVTFSELLSESDIVIVTCAMTESTKNLFNEAAFSKMKESSIFINTSRGGVVDQSALIDGLKRNFARRSGNTSSDYLGGPSMAGLDVTVPEPLETDSELLKLENCLVVPHIGSATVETRESMAELAVLNCLGAFGLNGNQGMLAEVK